jgi:hypothetical protein
VRAMLGNIMWVHYNKLIEEGNILLG